MSLSEKSSKQTVPALQKLVEASAFNNRLVVKHYNNLTMHQALTAGTPSLGALSKINEDKAIIGIKNLFKAVSMYFDNILPDGKAEVIAVELLSKYEYRSLRLEDLVVICKNLKESDVFKITPARILREIKKYSDNREKLAIQLSKQSSDIAKQSVNYQLEARLQKHFKSAPNANRLASKRNSVSNKFK
ncbi:hypothetical protein PG913_08365 [Tenacibaculum pacificus]|uniref:hypothetical protein n=4 Tax=Tenacibaculum TaxID=104267 RepID=UPI0022F3FCD9|nr:hypothetical protein [Tenacibaculum pacificus]WBX72916.1 hypothetical protein PG913_08365 [Tenacibaculum pacificus]